MDISGFRHIIWDWNGTLLDDTRLCLAILNRILEEEEKPPVDMEAYREAFNFPVRNYYRFLGLDPGRKSFEEYSADYIREYSTRWCHCQIHDGAGVLLRFFREQGMEQSILSASEGNLLQQAVAYYDLDSYFIGMVGLDNFHARGKLDSGRHWLGKLDCHPEEVLLLGDTLHDFEVAQALGVRCILFAHGHHSTRRLQGSGGVVYENFGSFMNALISEERGNLADVKSDSL